MVTIGKNKNNSGARQSSNILSLTAVDPNPSIVLLKKEILALLPKL